MEKKRPYKTVPERTSAEAKREYRRSLIAQALAQGLTYRDMAAHPDIDCSIATISRDVNVIMKRWRDEQITTIDEWVTLQMTRTNMLLNASWHKALNGDRRATNDILKLIALQGKVMGIDYKEVARLTGRDRVSKEAPVDPDSVEGWILQDQERQRQLNKMLEDFTDQKTGEVIGVTEDMYGDT